MDDIRRPNPQRRDFAMRHRAHQPRPGVMDLRPTEPTPPQPVAQPPVQAQEAYVPATDYQSNLAPAAAAETGYEYYSRPVTRPAARPAGGSRRLPKIRPRYAVGGLAAFLLIGASLYMLTRPAQTSGFSVAQLSKKSGFGFYYPQPLPSGYTYVTKINAFQGGQAYFMLAKGSKHLFIHEQAAANQGTGGLSSPQPLPSPVGKAVIGQQAGQPAAKVVAGSTLISINSTGGVASTDLSKLIDSLKTDR